MVWSTWFGVREFIPDVADFGNPGAAQMDVPCSLALSIFGLQLVVTIPVLFFLRNARDKALMAFRVPDFSLGWIVLLLLSFVAVVVPFIVLSLWAVVAGVSGAMLVFTLGLGFWLGR